MSLTHTNINAGSINSKQEISFCYEETGWPNNKNEFENKNPDSCPLHSNSPPIQQPCSSNENVSVYQNVIDEILSDIEYKTHETPECLVRMCKLIYFCRKLSLPRTFRHAKIPECEYMVRSSQSHA